MERASRSPLVPVLVTLEAPQLVPLPARCLLLQRIWSPLPSDEECSRSLEQRAESCWLQPGKILPAGLQHRKFVALLMGVQAPCQSAAFADDCEKRFQGKNSGINLATSCSGSGPP